MRVIAHIINWEGRLVKEDFLFESHAVIVA